MRRRNGRPVAECDRRDRRKRQQRRLSGVSHPEKAEARHLLRTNGTPSTERRQRRDERRKRLNLPFPSALGLRVPAPQSFDESFRARPSRLLSRGAPLRRWPFARRDARSEPQSVGRRSSLASRPLEGRHRSRAAPRPRRLGPRARGTGTHPLVLHADGARLCRTPFWGGGRLRLHGRALRVSRRASGSSSSANASSSPGRTSSSPAAIASTRPSAASIPTCTRFRAASTPPTSSRRGGQTSPPGDQAAIPRPRLGYFGVIDERIDLGLLERLASARPEWQIVMVGPVVKIDPDSLPRRPNIHWLGQKSYDELPSYLAGWDVAIMPFALNESTRFISPTKTLEYLAAGKPVVSTRDSRRRAPVRRAGSRADRRRGDVRGRNRGGSRRGRGRGERAPRRADAYVAGTSWDDTQARMDEVLTRAVRTPLRAPMANAEGPSPSRPPGPWRRNDDMFDYLIVGAGFAGSVVAERLATQRASASSSATSARTSAGMPTTTTMTPASSCTSTDRTSSTRLRRASSSTCRSSRSGARTSIASSLASTGSSCPFRSTSTPSIGSTARRCRRAEVEAFFERVAVPITHPKTSEEAVICKMGATSTRSSSRNYTRKQWGARPVGARRLRGRARPGAHEPRRPLLHRRLPGHAAPRLHAHVRAHARPQEHPHLSSIPTTATSSAK